MPETKKLAEFRERKIRNSGTIGLSQKRAEFFRIWNNRAKTVQIAFLASGTIGLFEKRQNLCCFCFPQTSHTSSDRCEISNLASKPKKLEH